MGERDYGRVEVAFALVAGATGLCCRIASDSDSDDGSTGDCGGLALLPVDDEKDAGGSAV